MQLEIKKKSFIFQGSLGYLIVINDLTAISIEKQAQAMEQCSEVMIATTSHDLRTPINSMKNMLILLQEEVISDQGKVYLQVAE